METKVYIEISELLGRFYDKYDGFIVTHGTDTMCYTASVLSFMLQNLKKLVIITGSMIPLSYKDNDAKNNLAGSLILSGHIDTHEVCIYMNDRLLRGNRSKKNFTDKIEAFESPMIDPLVVFDDINSNG